MKNEILQAFNETATEADYQEKLALLVKQGRNATHAVKTARPVLHEKVEELARTGVVQGRLREHAVLDFDLDRYEQPATALKKTAQKTLLIRRLIYPQQEVTADRRSSQLQRLKAAGIL